MLANEIDQLLADENEHLGKLHKIVKDTIGCSGICHPVGIPAPPEAKLIFVIGQARRWPFIIPQRLTK